MKAVLCIFCSAVAFVSLAAPVNSPVVDIDYQKHLKLWRAQRSILTAWEYSSQADRESPNGLGSHAAKARELLTQAAKELKLASMESTAR